MKRLDQEILAFIIILAMVILAILLLAGGTALYHARMAELGYVQCPSVDGLIWQRECGK